MANNIEWQIVAPPRAWTWPQHLPKR